MLHLSEILKYRRKSMEELRKKLSNNYMVMTEYFNESFSFFKFLLKKEFIWFVMIILLSVTSQVFFEDITHITFPIYFFIFKLLIKKIIEIIEEKKSIRNRKVLGKMFLYFGSLPRIGNEIRLFYLQKGGNRRDRLQGDYS